MRSTLLNGESGNRTFAVILETGDEAMSCLQTFLGSRPPWRRWRASPRRPGSPRRAAGAIIDLRRVREAKLPLVAALHADPKMAAGPLRELMRLDRYERRALWRRKLAIRAFIAAVAPSAPPPTSKTNPTEKPQ